MTDVCVWILFQRKKKYQEEYTSGELKEYIFVLLENV